MNKVLHLVIFSVALSGCIEINFSGQAETNDNSEEVETEQSTADPSEEGSTEEESLSSDKDDQPINPIENQPPIISGSPTEVVIIGEYYEFIPTAIDSDSDSLVFSVENLPIWASFDTNTGSIYGHTTEIKLYEGITISVSDGNSTASLDPFNLDVQSQQSKNVFLQWQPPTEDTDGNTINNINGYKIYYGQNQGEFTNTVTVSSGSAVETEVQNLEPGHYYFSMSAVTTSGVESDRSNEYYIEVTE